MSRLMSKLLGVCALIFAANTALAQTPITYTDRDKALFTFDAPDFWTMRSGGLRLLSPPGGDQDRVVARVIGLEPSAEKGIFVGFVSPFGLSTIKEGLTYLRNVGPQLVKDATLDDFEKRQIGGMPAVTADGRGRRNGRKVNFTAVVVDLPGNRIAVSLVVMEAGVNPELAKDADAMFTSLRAAR